MERAWMEFGRFERDQFPATRDVPNLDLAGLTLLNDRVHCERATFRPSELRAQPLLSARGIERSNICWPLAKAQSLWRVTRSIGVRTGRSSLLLTHSAARRWPSSLIFRSICVETSSPRGMVRAN